jgi:hypothetical protein
MLLETSGKLNSIRPVISTCDNVLYHSLSPQPLKAGNNKAFKIQP